MRIHDLKPRPASRKNRKRVGRGTGSGLGTHAGRGDGGQKSRSGGSVRLGFEGGQTPLFRRLPKRGFKNIFADKYSAVNVRALNRFDEGTEITPELLLEAGLIKRRNKVKIMGDGDLKHSLTIKAHKFTKSALEKIEAAGGRAEVL